MLRLHGMSSCGNVARRLPGGLATTACRLRVCAAPVPWCRLGAAHARAHPHHAAAAAAAHQPGAVTHQPGAAAHQHGCGDARAAYVHLPFCKRKCHYCDFPVTAVGSNLGTLKVTNSMQAYVDAVIAEMQAQPRFGSQPLTSVYFGGGTPSLVPPPLVATLLDTLRSRYGIAPGAEISMEADPGTFDDERLAGYLALGVTRISMGVQSFQQENLITCGRSHDIAEVRNAIGCVARSGVSSWSLDLISGLPGLSMADWKESLREAVAARPDHLSVYDLQVEEGTPFARWHDQGKLSFPTDDDAASMYAEAVATLTAAGYEHYEVSNYARPGHRSRHNQVYWSGVPYYAFGVGAASYLAGARYTRPAKQQAYLDWVRAGCDASGGGSSVPQTPEDALLDTIMLSLRTADGLDMALIAKAHGGKAAAVVFAALARHIDRGLAQRLPRLAVATAVPGEQHEQHEQQQEQAQEQQEQEQEGRGASEGAAGPGSDSIDSNSSNSSSSSSTWGALSASAHRRWDFRVRLADPHGFLLSNDIISDVFAALSFEGGEKKPRATSR